MAKGGSEQVMEVSSVRPPALSHTVLEEGEEEERLEGGAL
jgi:hypothetical protein